MSGFGSGSFSGGPFGEFPWSEEVLLRLLPAVYRDQDADAGGHLLVLMQTLRPLFDNIRLKIGDLGELRDALLCQTDHTFTEAVKILQVDDVGDGTSNVYLSQGPNGDKYNGIRIGHTLTDHRGQRFMVLAVRSAVLAKDTKDPPVDPETSAKSGRHIVVSNISIGSNWSIPLVSGVDVTNENPTPSPLDNGILGGPYVFTTAFFPVARNRMVVTWKIGTVAHTGTFNNNGTISGGLGIGSVLNFTTGVTTISTDDQVVDADSIRISYTKSSITPPEDASISSQNILAFLAQDYGITIDRHDSESLQRSLVYHATQLWDIKGTEDGYKYLGLLAGFIVKPHGLYRLSSAFSGSLDPSHVFEIPSGSGVFYTDLDPERVLFDDVIADVLPLDLFCNEAAFPAVAQAITAVTVAVIGADGSETRWAVTAFAANMSQSFNTHGHFTDFAGHVFLVENFLRLTNTTYSFEVVSISSPSAGVGSVLWSVLKFSNSLPVPLPAIPDMTLAGIGTDVFEIGTQYHGFSGKRYKVIAALSDLLPFITVGNVAFIDANGRVSFVESIRNMSGFTYQIEIVSNFAPAAGNANIFYDCGIVTDCSFCRASVLRMLISPGAVLATPSALAEDAPGRLITRLQQMVPAHVRTTEFVYTPGPALAAFHIVATSTAPLGSVIEIPYSAYYDYSSWPADPDAVSLDHRPIIATSDSTVTTLNVFEEFLSSPSDNDPIGSGVWTASGLWHVSEYRSSTQFRSFNYGRNDIGRLGAIGSVPPDFNTGGATAGLLTSPVIVGVGAASQVNLRFRHYADMESSLLSDLAVVVVKTSPGGFVLATFDKTSLGLNISGTTGGAFVTVIKDITAIVGMGDFIVQFSFDSVDGIANTTECWYIDDIEVQVIP